MPPFVRRFLVALACAGLSGCNLTAAHATCEGNHAHLYVDTAAHRLLLCAQGAAEASYDVRLGKGGLGKTRAGDGKVPLGTYGLGKPRPSQLFGTFISIQYPTKEQRAQGYTGTAVGVHGPHQEWLRFARLINLFDTTDGCVGLATNEEMKEISAWVARTGAAQITIE